MPAHYTPRIALFTGSGRVFLDPLLADNHHLVAVIEHDEYPEQAPATSAFVKILQHLSKMFFKSPHSLSLRAFCKKQNIAYYHFDDNENLHKWLVTIKPDILISHLAPVLPEKIFSLPAAGTVNIHPSLLPDYRGANPHFWVYYDRKKYTGVTLHYINKGVDSGDIIEQKSITIEPGLDFKALQTRLLKDTAVPMLLTFLKRMRNHEPIPRTPQHTASTTVYARRISNQEYIRLLNFERLELEHIWHVMHANEQWQFCYLNKRQRTLAKWSIDNYEYGISRAPYGTLTRMQGRFCLTHPQGVIVLRRTYGLKQIIKILLSPGLLVMLLSQSSDYS